MEFVNYVKDKINGKVPAGKARSKMWSKVRDEHLNGNRNCAVCNGNKRLRVHHKLPFHLRPDLELDKMNLVTLCEGKGLNCHLVFGHLGCFKSYNAAIVVDVEIWRRKIFNRLR